MNARVHIEPLAKLDLRKQFDYFVERASIDIANRFVDAAHETFGELAKSPGLGGKFPARSPKLAGLRVWRVSGFENHLVFYRESSDGVEIVRVLHGARDVRRALLTERP